MVDVGERALWRAIGVAAGGFVGALVGHSIAVNGSCEPDYPMLCELAGVFGGGLGVAVGAIVAVSVVSMAQRRGSLPRSVTGGLALGAAIVLLGVRLSYPSAFRNAVQNSGFWVGVCVVLAAIVGVLTLALGRRALGGPAEHSRPSPS